MHYPFSSSSSNNGGGGGGGRRRSRDKLPVNKRIALGVTWISWKETGRMEESSYWQRITSYGGL
jgi:hypothetical protein